MNLEQALAYQERAFGRNMDRMLKEQKFNRSPEGIQLRKNREADAKARKLLREHYNTIGKKQMPDSTNLNAYYQGWADAYNSRPGNWRGD